MGALGLASRNATTRSVAWTMSAGTSRAAMRQKMQSLACPIFVIPFNLAEPSIPGQCQRRSYHGRRLGAQDTRPKARDPEPRIPCLRDPGIGESSLRADQEMDPAG